MTLVPCRLYLVTPARFDPTAFVDLLRPVLAAADVASLELRLEDAEPEAWVQAIDALTPLTQAHDVALLLADRPQMAAETGCDGVYLSFLEGYAEARRVLGAGAIVGVAAQGSRHQAMEAGDLGAEFVGIGPAGEGGPALELVTWWAELMEVPSVSFGPRTPEECALAVDAGADFLSPDPAFWTAAKDPAATLVGLLSAVSRAD